MTSKTLLFAVIFGAVCVSGCSSTRQVNLDSPDAAETLRAINEGAQHRQAKVNYADQQHAAARSLLVTPDTTSWLVAPGDGRRVMTPTQGLERVRFKRRGQGAMEGLALGALAGVATSFGMLLSGQEFKDATRGIQVLIPVGSLVGLVFGAIRGTRRTYVFRPAPLPARLPPMIAAESSVPEPTPAAAEEPIAEEPIVEEPIAEEQPVAEAAVPAVPVIPFDRTQVSWTLVVASYPERSAAEAEAAAFREKLHPTDYPVDVVADAGQYRVVVGQFETLTVAQAAQQAMGEAVPGSAWLLYYQPVGGGGPNAGDQDTQFGAAHAAPSSTEAARAAEATRVDETTRIAKAARAIEQSPQNLASLHDVAMLPVQTPPVARQEPVADEQGRWTVVVATHPAQAPAEADAAHYREKLGEAGYPVAVVAEGGQHRVVVGQFRKLTLAQVALQSLKAHGAEGAWLMNAQHVSEGAFKALATASAAKALADPQAFDSVITLHDILVPLTQAAPAAQHPVSSDVPAYAERQRPYWTLVVGSHPAPALAEADAAHYRNTLGHAGYPVNLVNEGVQHRVEVGQFETLTEAMAAQQALATDIPDEAWLLNVEAAAGSATASYDPASSPLPAAVEGPAPEEERVIEEETTPIALPETKEPVVVEGPPPAVRLVRLGRTPSYWTVVVASHAAPAQAEADAAQYRDRLGETDYAVEVIVEGGQHRVVVGQFRKLAQAQSALQGLGDDGAQGAWLLYYQPKQ